MLPVPFLESRSSSALSDRSAKPAWHHAESAGFISVSEPAAGPEIYCQGIKCQVMGVAVQAEYPATILVLK